MKEGLYREVKTDSLLDGAIADYRAATELDHHLTSAWQQLGSAYSSAGLYPDALLAIQHAFDEDVFLLHQNALQRNRFDVSMLADHMDSAESACRTGLSWTPPDPLLVDCEVQIWSRTRGDRRLAAAARARVDSLAPSAAGSMMRPLWELWVAEILARAGLGDSADHVAQRALAHTSVAWHSVLLPEAAYLRLLRHDPDSALVLVAAAVRIDPVNRRYIREAPMFKALRDDPRFTAAVGGGEAPRR